MPFPSLRNVRFDSGRLVLAASVAGLILLLIGCGGGAQKKRSGADGYHELIRSQQQALALEQLNQPVVHIRGQVQNPVVPWRESLTLADALLEAVYTPPLSPRAIRVHRTGQPYNIDVRRLLRGTENPILEPGDVIEVIR
jgi:hypothetical protein